MMKSLLVLAFVCLAVAQNNVGICRFVPTGADNSGSITGTATFSTTADGSVSVTVNAAGIPDNGLGAVGIHVHTYGDIRESEPQAGFNVGGHYNPTGVAYGCPGQAVREYGDMGNWTLNDDGTVSETKTLDLLALTGGLSIIGRSVVIHAKTDNCVNLTSSGTRMAYCVIGIANTTATTTTANGAYNSNTTINYGTCSLSPVAGSTFTGSGLVTFAVTSAGIVVKANVTGLDANSVHGIHIHQFGDILSSAQVGGHYDPAETKVHALPTFLPDGSHHIGDLGNICDTANGVHYYQATFAAPKFADQNGIIGRALVIHSGADDNTTVTYGSRIAYCVIGVAPSDFLASTFATPPVTFTSPLCGYSVPTAAPAKTSDAADLATISVFIAITTILAMLF